MTQKLATLDVVVPCYNEEDTIAKCLDALLNQGDEIKRIIVVDNNSTDDTVNIIKSYKQNSATNITLIREKRQGVQFARSKGFNNATADIIARIDADAIVQTGWANAIRTHYAVLPELGAAFGNCTHHDLPFINTSNMITDFFCQSINLKFADGQLIYGANMTIRRAMWQLIKHDVCMCKGIMEDVDIGYHVRRTGGGVGYIPRARAYVSGRRIRMSPLRYWRYTRQWWMTFKIHGQHLIAFNMRMITWQVNVLHLFVWLLLQFHDPVQNRFRLGYLFEQKVERVIP